MHDVRAPNALTPANVLSGCLLRDILQGSLAENTSQLAGSILETDHVSGVLNTSDVIKGIITGIDRQWEHYTGPFEVVPSTHDDVLLKTNNRILSDDITVFKIPTYETSNVSGTTFIIGDD